ncbi:Fc.00g047100.m01.CDS01 [Cosmosporella sp. VM-42]
MANAEAVPEEEDAFETSSEDEHAEEDEMTSAEGEEHQEGAIPDDASSISVALSVETDDDGDSALGDDIVRSPSAASLTPSFFDFPEEFGRTWHKYKQGTYFLPNDEREQERLDLEHAISLRVFEDRLNYAPVDKPNRVLDVGTGTGIWAIEFASQHPESDVLGTDLSPIQPPLVPSNCHFELDDCEALWVFRFPFDYVHIRYLCPFLRDNPRLMTSIYDHLNPGGWVEFQEAIIQFRCIDSSLDGTVLEKWNEHLRDGIRNLGRDVYAPLRCREYLLDAGFENVEQRKFVIPTSPWAKGTDEKTLGFMQMKSNLAGIPALTQWVFAKGLQWQREQVEVFLVDVRKELMDRGIHAYFTLIAVWAQKPVNSAS